ncbi:sigma-70 family RNA polymerase sigma factor [Desulfoscipio sp. XC116]|uniref:RNA polymerase sigma factor n=1 Tax=Desulfoscipio sp. XC116 TaxID=3144975 RepID=UPI00325B819B
MFKNPSENKAKKLDKECSRLIFTLYYETAYKAAYFYCGDKYIAEEAAQEAIYKAIQNIHQLNDPGKIEDWIKKIAINNVNAIFKEHEKEVNLEKSLPISDLPENLPEYVVVSQETVDTVDRAIESLDPVMKQVIRLRFYEEMKVKDISLLLNKPEGTIKIWLYRGKALIKKQLLREGYIKINDDLIGAKIIKGGINK